MLVRAFLRCSCAPLTLCASFALGPDSSSSLVSRRARATFCICDADVRFISPSLDLSVIYDTRHYYSQESQRQRVHNLSRRAFACPVLLF